MGLSCWSGGRCRPIKSMAETHVQARRPTRKTPRCPIDATHLPAHHHHLKPPQTDTTHRRPSQNRSLSLAHLGPPIGPPLGPTTWEACIGMRSRTHCTPNTLFFWSAQVYGNECISPTSPSTTSPASYLARIAGVCAPPGAARRRWRKHQRMRRQQEQRKHIYLGLPGVYRLRPRAARVGSTMGYIHGTRSSDLAGGWEASSGVRPVPMQPYDPLLSCYQSTGNVAAMCRAIWIPMSRMRPVELEACVRHMRVTSTSPTPQSTICGHPAYSSVTQPICADETVLM